MLIGSALQAFCIWGTTYMNSTLGWETMAYTADGILVYTMPPTNDEPERAKAPKTLRDHFGAALRRRRRPTVSLLLMGAIVVVVFFGVQFVYIRDDPKRLAFFLALNFIFFFVVMYRAIVECIEIVREHFKENEQIFRSTLGDEEFTADLGRRVAESEKE
jgi:hypothetical protein